MIQSKKLENLSFHNGNTDLLASIEKGMDYEVLNKVQLGEFKQILSNQIQQAYKLNQTLLNRCAKLKEILTVFDTSIQYESNLILKHRYIPKNP